jgi:hypothetical protein
MSKSWRAMVGVAGCGRVLVGARGLDVAGLLAFVADTLVGGLRWAVAAQVAHLTA